MGLKQSPDVREYQILYEIKKQQALGKRPKMFSNKLNINVQKTHSSVESTTERMNKLKTECLITP